jgi:peptidoglycan/xylan/chitin deacetylase (PgdA/CDA1 family)
VLRLVARRVRRIVFFVETHERAVALSLDDGPDPSITPDVLDVLRKRDARATFFVIGSKGEQHPELLRRIAAEGHELGNHTWREERSAGLSAAAFEQSLEQTHRLLAAVAPVRLFRPGSGWTTRRMLAAVEKRGYRCVLGSVYLHDVRPSRTANLAVSVLARVRPGAIVILHEGKPERAGIVCVLDEVLAELRRRRYRVVTVSELLELGES